MSDERRRFTRVPFKARAQLEAGGKRFEAGEITDLGVGGCLLPLSDGPDEGTQCHVKVLLEGTSSSLALEVEGEVSRRETGTVAVKFTRIDPDSLFHLQNVIRYNSADADVIEREIGQHPGIL